jgi:hypothetical protein
MDPKVENEEYGRSPLAESAQVHSSRGDLTNTVRNRGFGVHSPSRGHDGDGDARTRVTNQHAVEQAGSCVTKRLRDSRHPGHSPSASHAPLRATTSGWLLGAESRKVQDLGSGQGRRGVERGQAKAVQPASNAGT